MLVAFRAKSYTGFVYVIFIYISVILASKMRPKRKVLTTTMFDACAYGLAISPTKNTVSGMILDLFLHNYVGQYNLL